jgi:UDP-2-acetamido-3-amino-2,3-dideoxy-glucuronate N-acetyltransferase
MHSNNLKFSIITDVEIGENTIIRDHVNLYKCKVGKNCKIESFVYIEEGVVIGDNCKIKPFVFIPTGVTIGNDVFIGPNVTFTNDKYPKTAGAWTQVNTLVKSGASLGANCVILPGVTVGQGALIGSGAVASKDVPDRAIVIGNPAKIIGYRE